MDLARLTVAPVAPDDEPRFRALMDEHHYLGAPSKIGQTVWHAAEDGSGAWPALAAFSAAALKCIARDGWIGWSPHDQFGRLHLIANNVRLLLPGRHPNLGSRFLALCARRISADWQARHRHPLLLLETLVDPARFRGTVCRAANWMPVGEPRGFRRRGDGYVAESTPKQVLLLPLDRNAPEPAPRTRTGSKPSTAWSREDERGRSGRNPGVLQGRRRSPRPQRAPPPHRAPARALHRGHALRGDGMDVARRAGWTPIGVLTH